MNAIIAGVAIAYAALHIWYYCNRKDWLERAAKALLVHRAGIIAKEQAEREAAKMDVKLEGGA